MSTRTEADIPEIVRTTPLCPVLLTLALARAYGTAVSRN